MSVLRGGASYASQGRISVTGHRAEPNEHGRSMCRGRYSACSGYNCRWWAAVALGGPVSINQPALNTRASERASAGFGQESADRTTRRPIAIAPNAVRAHDLCLAANCRGERSRGVVVVASFAARQNIAVFFFSTSSEWSLRVRARFCKTHATCSHALWICVSAARDENPERTRSP